MQGSIYVLTNPAYPGLLKIGKTTRSVLERAKELGTGNPENYLIVYSVLVTDVDLIEKEIHRYLDSHRHRDDREFFNISIKAAIAAVDRVIEDLGGLNEPELDECIEQLDFSIFHLEYIVAPFSYYERFCCLLDQGDLSVETLYKRVRSFHKEFDIDTPLKPQKIERLVQSNISTSAYNRFTQRVLVDIDTYIGGIDPSEHDHRFTASPVADGLTLLYEETPLLKTDRGLFIRESQPEVIKPYRIRVKETVMRAAQQAGKSYDRQKQLVRHNTRMQHANRLREKYGGKV